METLSETKLRFNNFEIDCSRRILTRDGEPLALKSKTFDLLQHLIKNRGIIVTKDELLTNIWPGQFVEENNLTVQISALRKVFGGKNGSNRFITTVPGKGYSFVADVELDDETHDIVIENHSFSRIVIEEQILNKGNVQSRLNVARAQIGSDTGSRQRFQMVGVLVVAAILSSVAAGAYVFGDRLFSNRSVGGSFAGRNVRQLTTNGKVGNAALSPDGKVFVYTIDDLGSQSLWLGYVDGGNHLLLREAGDVSYRSLTFSPDGTTIWFSAVDEKNSKGAIFEMPVLGGVPTKRRDEIRIFSLSPDGKQIAFNRTETDGTLNIVTAAVDGSNDRIVTSLQLGISIYPGSISWSPDSSRFAFGMAKDYAKTFDSIGIVDVISGKLTEIEEKNFRQITKTAWIANGEQLVITAVELASQASVPQYQLWNVDLRTGNFNLITPDRSNYGESWHNESGATLGVSQNQAMLISVEHRQSTNIWVAPTDDLSAAKQITNGSYGKYDGLWGLDWTPDGKVIYTTSDTRSQFLAEMEPDGSKQKPITSTGKIDSVLTVSEDGRYILFHSNRTSELDIWRTDIDGSNPKQLTFGGKGYHPAPSTDGLWVYFKSWARNIGELCRVPIDGGETECLNDKETSWISFSPDGKYFAALVRTDKLRLAVFSAETNQVVNQFDLAKSGTFYMGSRWSPGSKFVVYRDRNYGYWKQAVDGGEATRIEGLPKERLYNFAFSKDGKQFAYVRGEESRDVVIFQERAE